MKKNKSSSFLDDMIIKTVAKQRRFLFFLQGLPLEKENNNAVYLHLYLKLRACEVKRNG